MELKDKYVYLHRRNDTNEVFYVGIGGGKRAYWNGRRNSHWQDIVNEVGYTIEKPQEGLTMDEACVYEVNYIKEYGRKDLGLGNLVNLTDGGKGQKGRITSKESKKKLSDKKLGEKHNRSKLTKEEVLKMRELYKKGLTQQSIATMFGVVKGHVGGIVRKERWKHI